MNTDPWLIQLLRDVIENDLGVAFFTPQSFSITFISVISFNVWWGPKSRPEGAEMLDFISFWFPFWMLLVDILEVTVCLEWFSVWLWGLVVGGVSLIALGEDFWAAQRWAFFGHVLRSDLGGWCGWWWMPTLAKVDHHPRGLIFLGPFIVDFHISLLLDLIWSLNFIRFLCCGFVFLGFCLDLGFIVLQRRWIIEFPVLGFVYFLSLSLFFFNGLSFGAFLGLDIFNF